MQEEKHWTEPACLPLLSKYLEGQMISGDIYSASAMSFSLCRQRRSPLFQHRNNVGGMPVLLHHAATSLINFTPSAVRSQRGALSPSVKYQTSSHSSPVRVCSILAPPGVPAEAGVVRGSICITNQDQKQRALVWREGYQRSDFR